MAPGDFPDENQQSVLNTTVIARPGESIRVTLRIVQDTAAQPFCSADEFDVNGDPNPDYCFAPGKLVFRGKALAPNTGDTDPRETVLGALPDQRFAEGSVTLSPHESLVLYTDGVIEARSPEGEFFCDTRFQAMLKSMPDAPPRQICESAIAAVHAFQSGELHDDVTLLVLRRGA